MSAEGSAIRYWAGSCALFGAALLWVLRPIWGIDIFFHVAIGRYVAAHGMPATDVFSAADADAAWTPFQVGYELLVAGVDALGGLDALRVVHACLVAATVVVLWWRLRQSTASVAVSFVLLSLFLVLYDDRIRLRPHVVNLVFEVTLLLPLAAGRIAIGRARWLVWLPLVSLAWAFMHAMGALWLCAVLGTWLVGGAPEYRRWALAALALSVLGVACAPGALSGILHVLSIQDQWKEFVPELAPSWALFSMGGAYGVVAGSAPWLAAGAVGLAWISHPEPAQRPALLAAAGFAFAALWLARLGYYSVFVLALCWPALRARLDMRIPRRMSVLPWLAGAGLLTLIALHVHPRFTARSINPWTTTLYPGAFPEREADALVASGVSGRAYNEVAWGGYLLYRLFPRVRVLTDGRITFGADVAELLRREREVAPAISAEVAHQRFGIDMLVWRRGRLEPGNPHWRLLVRGPVAEVWTRVNPSADGR